MAQAYADYVALATFPPDTPPAAPAFTGLEMAAMKAVLLGFMNQFVPNPAGLGSMWAAGIQTFWLSPPIICGGAAPGTVTSIPGLASLPGAMLSIAIIPAAPAAVAASAVAAAIHAATQTVTATLTIAGTPTPVVIV